MLKWFFELWDKREVFRAFVETHPVEGSLGFVALQSLQVVIAPLPGEATGLLAGFLFGAVKGFILSMLGIAIGSFIAFFIPRIFAKKLIKKWQNSQTYLKVKKIFKKRGLTGIFVLYLIPGFPKDILNYVLSFMPIRFKAFFVVCLLGRAPATFALTLQGDTLYHASLKKNLILLLFFSFVIFLYFIFKKRILSWLEE